MARRARTAPADEVVAFLGSADSQAAELALWARSQLLTNEPDLTERVYRGWNGVGYHHAEAGYVCAIFPRDDGLILLFEHGARLPDPAGLLEGDGSQTRFLRIDAADERTADAIAVLLERAILHRIM